VQNGKKKSSAAAIGFVAFIDELFNFIADSLPYQRGGSPPFLFG
jgi:hypothetical protein